VVARRNNFYRFKARHYATRAQDIAPSPEAIRARTDLNFFTEYISGLPVGNQYHENWAKVWATGNSNDLLNNIAGPNVNVLAPRSSAKSTRLGYAVAWAIGHNPGLPILYISYAKPIAVSRSRLIKRILTHPRYCEVFPHIKPNKDKWSDTEWEIDKKEAGISNLEYDYTLLAVGISGAIVSKRAGLIVVDDPIKNRSSILNPEVREKIRNNWRTAVLPTLLPGSRIWGIGTRFHKDDIHVTDLCPEKGVEILEQGAIIIDDHGVERSYWESFAPYHDRFIEHQDGSQEVIRGLFEKREEDPVTFAFQMQNTIVSEYDVAIEESWIQWTEDIPNVDEFDQFAFGLDLAAREREQFDFTACVLLGKKGNKLYVLDGGRGRWPGNLDKINMILTMAYDWQLVRGIRDPETNDLIFKEQETVYVPIHAEDVNYQASLQSDWNTVVRDQYQIYNLRCIGAKAKGDKATRLKATTGTFQRKEIFFNTWRKKSLMPLVVELINFGSSTHDDYADAFAYGVNGIQKRSPLTSA
jgi:phage terminase large subunit-like protein